MSDKYIAMMKY